MWFRYRTRDDAAFAAMQAIVVLAAPGDPPPESSGPLPRARMVDGGTSEDFDAGRLSAKKMVELLTAPVARSVSRVRG